MLTALIQRKLQFRLIEYRPKKGKDFPIKEFSIDWKILTVFLACFTLYDLYIIYSFVRLKIPALQFIVVLQNVGYGAIVKI